MTDTQTDLPLPHSSNTCNYLRGISATLTFLFTLAALASNTLIPRIACIGAAGLTAGTAFAINHLANKKDRQQE